MDGDQAICVANVDFGEQRSTTFMHYEVDGVVHAGVGQREVVDVDAVIDATPWGEGQVHY